MTDYEHGWIDALKTFAWWKDGTEYVGCGNWTLKEALRNMRMFADYDDPKHRVRKSSREKYRTDE